MSQGKAVIYGVSTYDGISSLTAPVLDVASLTSLFSTQGWSVSSKTDTNATLTNFIAEIQALAANAKPFDRFFLYFSGHGGNAPIKDSSGTLLTGSPDSGQWIVFYDGASSTGDKLRPVGMLNAEKLASIVKPLLDKQALVLVTIDTCYSGGLVPDGEYVSGQPYNYANARPTYTESDTVGMFSQAFTQYFSADGNSTDSQGKPISGNNLWIISAAGSLEESWEIKNKYGIFTYYFSQSPKYGDQNGDNVVSIYEAYRYASKAIQKFWNDQVILSTDTRDLEFLPHISGNPYDFPLFKR